MSRIKIIRILIIYLIVVILASTALNKIFDNVEKVFKENIEINIRIGK